MIVIVKNCLICLIEDQFRKALKDISMRSGRWKTLEVNFKQIIWFIAKIIKRNQVNVW